MEPITFDELKRAADVFNRVNEIRRYVTRERFDLMAKTRFGIDDETKLDVMYGLLNMTPRLVYYITNYNDEKICKEGRLSLLPKAIEIAEAAYSMKSQDWDAETVPSIEYERYKRTDMRRYFYNDGNGKHALDVSMSSRFGILALSELLQRDDVTLRGVSEHLGYLKGAQEGREREKLPYFDGDIYLLYGNPTDRLFYNYLYTDSGVYVATPKGWRKLIYTPTRGYVTKDGELDFVDDECFYSDHKLEASGKGFLYVGNIHDDMSVLTERKED